MGTIPSRRFGLLPLYLVIFFGFVGYSLMITVFTPMLLHGGGNLLPPTTPLSCRTIILGLLLTTYPLGQFIGSPILGALSDRFGRKRVMALSLSVTTVCYALIAFSLEIGSLSLLMASAFVGGLAEGNVAIAQAAIADVSDSANRPRLFGYIYLSASLAYVVGPLVGGKLADSTLVSWFSYALPFWVVFALLIGSIGLLLLAFRESVAPKETPISYLQAFTNLKSVFTNRDVRVLYLTNFIVYLAIFGFFRCYPMYLVDEFKMGVAKVSNFIAWVAVPIILTNLWLTGFLSRKFSSGAIASVSALFLALFTASILLPRSENGLWVPLFLAALSLALLLPSCAALLSNRVGREEQGRALGNNQSLQVGAEAASGALGGLLAAVWIPLPLLILAGVSLAASGLFLHDWRHRL